MEDSKKQLHIAMFPLLAYGHIVPFLNVSKFLAKKGHQIYNISTLKNISRLPNLPSHLCSKIRFIQLPLPHVNGLPPGVESTSELPIHNVPYLKKAFEKLQSQITEFLKRSSRVKWIIHDFAPYWLPPVANQLDIHLVYFSIYSASTAAFAGPTSEVLSVSRQRLENFTVVPVWMDYPNTIAFKLHEILSHQECKDSVFDSKRFGTMLLSCKFVTLKSCFEVEPDTFCVLNNIYQNLVVPVGLLPLSMSSNENKGDENWKALKKWLDNKEENVVFYVAMGSEVNLSIEFMHELEKSGLPFIWVVRNPLPLKDSWSKT